MNAASITLIVPTYNRPQLLTRLLTHLTHTAWNGLVYIADSSHPESAATNQEIATEFSKHLNLHYTHDCPTVQPMLKLNKAVSTVETEFAVFCADDDLVLTSALLECCQFLSNHSDYTVCHGINLAYNFKEDGQKQKELTVGSDSFSGSRDEGLGLERFMMQLHGYAATFYGLHRTADMKYTFNRVNEFLPGYAPGNFHEFLQVLLTVIRGKTKRLPILYSVRKGFPSTEGWENALMRRDFSVHLEAMRQCAARELVDQDELNLTDALSLFDACFSRYIPLAIGPIPFPTTLGIFESMISRPTQTTLGPEIINGLLNQTKDQYQAIHDLILAHE